MRRTLSRAFQYGYTVDVDHLLFTPERDFLVKNNNGGTEDTVKADDLKGKTIVLIISPLYEQEGFVKPWHHGYRRPGCMPDMLDAYEQLVPMGGVEFVFVPVDLPNINSPNPHSKKDIYNQLLSTMPWPALPFQDAQQCGARVAETFSIDVVFTTPYWVIIDPTGKVVATRRMFPYLFKLFCGAELHPLSPRTICSLQNDFDPWPKCHRYGHRNRCKSRKRIIDEWDQHLASPPRDFLLASNHDQVPISDLQDKVIGLYFCENIPHPPRMELIKEVYDEAKRRDYAFEIVQINFHYHFFNAIYTQSADLDKEVVYEDINWLRLPFKDPSCRKLQRMFKCYFDEEDSDWRGDCLVIIDPREAQVLFEFCGAEIFSRYGIEAYPFTRPSLLKAERTREKEELKLEKLFPPGSCSFVRPACSGFDVTEDSPFTVQRVLVLFGDAKCMASEFVSMLKSKYRDQENENKFEVVHVPVDYDESSSALYIKDMPWLVARPHHRDFGRRCNRKVFKYGELDTGVAAFDKSGLIAKEGNFPHEWGKEEPDKFPFVSQDWEGWIKLEVQYQFDKYHYHIDC